MTANRTDIKKYLEKNGVSILCSGCWDLDELEEYLKQCEMKRIQSEKKDLNQQADRQS